MVFAFSSLAFIERMNGRIFESGNGGSKPDCPEQVGRTALGHLHPGAGEIAGLPYGWIDACISSELCRRGETPDIPADFRENDGSKSGADAGNGCKLRIKAGQQARDFGVENVHGRLQRANLFDMLSNDEREAAGSHHNAERISGCVLDFNGFFRAQPAATGLLRYLGKLLRGNRQHSFRRGVLGQDFHGRGSKGIRKELLVFREDLVKQSNDLALEIGSHIDDIEPLAAQLAHGLKVAGLYGCLAIPAKADDVGDDNAVNRIRLGLADVHAAQRIRLNGVDDMNRVAIIAQMGITAAPELLDLIDVKGSIVTEDAMSCQKEIVRKNRDKSELCDCTQAKSACALEQRRPVLSNEY